MRFTLFFRVLVQVRHSIVFADTPWSDRQPIALALEPPVFPYTDEECERLIDILEFFEGAFHLSCPSWPLLIGQFLEEQSRLHRSHHHLYR